MRTESQAAEEADCATNVKVAIAITFERPDYTLSELIGRTSAVLRETAARS